jgi:hypothetical protein
MRGAYQWQSSSLNESLLAFKIYSIKFPYVPLCVNCECFDTSLSWNALKVANVRAILRGDLKSSV